MTVLQTRKEMLLEYAKLSYKTNDALLHNKLMKLKKAMYITNLKQLGRLVK